MSVNKVILVGNCGRDPEIRSTPSGQTVCSFSVATSEKFKGRDGEGQEKTEWHNIVAWSKLADICGQYLKKGRQVYIEGKLTMRQYEAKNGGGTRYRTEIVAQTIQFLGSKANGSDNKPMSDEERDADIPWQ